MSNKIPKLTLIDCEKPIVAKVNGHAVGLGVSMALLSDVSFAAESAKIADPHVRIGLVPGNGGALIWPQLIGYARAKEYLLTGDAITARDAAAIGLINHVVPDAELDTAVETFARASGRRGNRGHSLHQGVHQHRA